MLNNISDEDLNYIQKHISKSTPEAIASHLKISTKEFYLARKGLTGQEIPSFFIIHRYAFQSIYSKLLVFFLLYLLFSNAIFHDGKGVNQLKYIIPSATFLLALFFLKFIFYKFTQIEQSPFDLIFIAIQSFAFVMSQFLKQETIVFALALIILLCVIIYYLTLHAIHENDLILMLKFLPFATLCLFLFVRFSPDVFISKNITQFLNLISIPLSICFLIYSQKSIITLYYGGMLGILSALYFLNFYTNQQWAYLCLVSLTFVGAILILKFSLKNQIILDHKFYWALLMIPLFFIINFLLLDPVEFQDPSLLKLSHNFWVKIPQYISSHLLLFSLFSVTILIPFLWYSYSIIRDADCFSEKIFASLGLPIIIAILTKVTAITLWEELIFYFVFIGFLGGFISRQYYYYMKTEEKAIVKIKKKTDLAPYPSLILSILILIGTFWFIIGVNF